MNKPIPPAHGSRRKGAALLITLAVMLLVVAYMAEYIFATGLELASMEGFRETRRGRNLALSAYHTIQQGLMASEGEFFQAMGQAKRVIDGGGAIPLGDGYLVGLKVAPADQLFNLNRLYSARSGSVANLAQWNLFANTLGQIIIPADEIHPVALPPDRDTVAWLFAALNDWMDPDNLDYTGYGGGLGAEGAAYLAVKPEYQVKDTRLDRLEEIRLVRGVVDSRIPWGEWENRFGVDERDDLSGNLYPGVINPNANTRQELIDFLKARAMDEGSMNYLDALNRTYQQELNRYADRAEEVADALMPADLPQQFYNEKELQAKLASLGFNAGYIRQAFTTAGVYYRVELAVLSGKLTVRLKATFKVVRNSQGLAQRVENVRFWMD